MSAQRVALVALFLGVLAAELAVAAPALALPAAAAPSPRRIVEIHVEGDRATLERVRAAASELLSEISVTPVVVADGISSIPAEPRESPFVSAYFDFRATPATIVIVDGASRRELDRRSLPPDTTLEAAVESGVHVLFMLVESLLDEQAAPPSEPPSAPVPAEHGASTDDTKDAAIRERPVPVATTPRAVGTRAAPRQDTGVSEVHASRRREPPVGLGVGVLARVLHFGAGQMLPSAGAELELSFARMRPRFGAAWYFVASTPFMLSSSEATAKLYPFSSGLLPNVEFELGEDFSAIAGAGVVLTWFSLKSAGPPGAAVGHSTGGVDTALSATVGVRARTGPRFSLTLVGGLDYDLEPRSFVAFDGGGGRHVLGALAQWRPSLSFVVAYSLFGAAARTNVAEAD